MAMTDSGPLLPEDMVRGVLKWLPTKSLMRFKTVSKLWRSVVIDPLFAESHRAPFRGLLLVERDYLRIRSTTNFYYANLDPPRSQLSLQLSVGSNFGMSQVVHGLVCFFDEAHRASLCNIATHEFRSLPGSRFDAKFSRYHLGFDPFNKLFKILKSCPVYEVEDDEDSLFVCNSSCEILTLGIDSSWRTIAPPPWSISSLNTTCINGVLYWMDPEDDEAELIAFNLAEEKFLVIPDPDGYGLGLPLFATSLVLLGAFTGDSEGVRICHYCEDKGSWADIHTFKFPYALRLENVDPTGMLPNGKLLIAENFAAGFDFPMPIYLYDESRRKLERGFRIHKSPSLSYGTIFGRLTYHEENIIPLSCLFGGSN